jgi:hypothetical protein
MKACKSGDGYCPINALAGHVRLSDLPGVMQARYTAAKNLTYFCPVPFNFARATSAGAGRCLLNKLSTIALDLGPT